MENISQIVGIGGILIAMVMLYSYVYFDYKDLKEGK